MKKPFEAIISKDGEWYIGHCPEVPGANGQGRTYEECLESLKEAIKLILEAGSDPQRGSDTEE